MSLQSLYATASRALQAHQAATNAAGNNIANAETPGFTRRTVSFRADPILRGGVVFQGPAGGGGVGVDRYERVRSGILDGAARRGRTGGDGADESARLLSGVESLVAPDGGGGVLDALGDFSDAWADVAAAPTERGARDALLGRAGTLVQTVRDADARLQSYADGVRSDLVSTVDRANGLMVEIAELNKTARSARAQGADDHDALDRRDVLLDELAGLAPIAVRPQDDGSVTVTIDGMVGVQDGEARPLRLELPPASAEPTLYAHGASRPLRLGSTEGGKLGAQLGTLVDTVPGTRAALDGLAADLVARVNGAHEAATGLDGATGRSFFDPTGTTAATLALGPDLTGPDAVAASQSGAPGDAEAAAQIAGVADDVQGAASRVLTRLGAQVRTATTAAEANGALAAHAQALRDGVSSVSLDEEMTNLIRHQQAYAASARVLNTATSLFDTLLTL
jgi:flagellar hook-associated protein 1 FlgK